MVDKNSVADWSTTASDNDNVGGVQLAENKMRPKDVNNAIRTVMAQVRGAVGIGKGFDTVADLIADATLSSANVSQGDIIKAQGFRYEVAAADATDNDIATAGGIKLYVKSDDGAYSFEAFGAALDGVTNDDTPVTQALTHPGMFILNKACLVTAIPTLNADQRVVGLGRFVDANSARFGHELGTDITVYVDSDNGDDANDGSDASPYRTLNRALHAVRMDMPFGFSQTIRLRGVNKHTLSDIPAADMQRPALAYITQAPSGDRTDQTTTSLVGPLIITSDTDDAADAIIELGASFKYGAYVTNGRTVGFANLTIQVDGTNAANALLVAHRQGYVHARNIHLIGGTGTARAQQCVVSESGGVMEITGSSVIEGSTTAVFATDGTLMVLADSTVVKDATSTALSGRAGVIKIANTCDISGQINVQGATLIFIGNSDSARTVVSSNIYGRDTKIDALWTDFSGSLNLEGCEIEFAAVNWSKQCIVKGGRINLTAGSKSYISPATASTVADPLVLFSDAQFMSDQFSGGAGSFTYLGSTGKTSPSRIVSGQSITANSQTLTYYALGGRRSVLPITASAAGAYTGTKLPTTSTDLGKPPNIGEELVIVFGGGGSVEIVESTTAVIAGNSIVLGLGTGQYTSITFYWSGAAWSEVARSGVS